MASLPQEMPTGDLHGDVINWYRDKLAQPATFPWKGLRWEPVRIGPTWQTTKDGHWLLPEATLGWDVLGFCGTWMQHSAGRPWRFTMEQARFILWFHSVDERGRFNYYASVLQRLKGHGKDPLAAAMCGAELVGPSQVAYMENDQPVATANAEPWVQTAAVKQEQTKNLMKLYPTLWTPEAKREFGLQIGKTSVNALNGEALMEALTASPSGFDGSRASLVVLNETHRWKPNNSGHEMADVIEANSAKSEEGGARTLAITNSFEPGEDSVAERDRTAFDDAMEGRSLTEGILYDSLEAPPDAPLRADAIEEVVRAVRGDSTWLDLERIKKFVLDTRNPPSRSRRFFYNQVVAAEDAWIIPQHFQAAAVDLPVLESEETVLFFDGSKSDDATGLIECRMSDGHVITSAMWQRPPGLRKDERWLIPRATVDEHVREILATHNVVAFWGDPSHVLDDETQDRFWDGIFDGWHADFGHQFDKEYWAVGAGVGAHSIMWDMAAPSRTRAFTDAAQRTREEITQTGANIDKGLAPVFTHDGDSRLVRHVSNARSYPNRYGTSIWKGHRESAKKVDLAVCMIGARMLRRHVLLKSAGKKKRSGKVW